MVKGRSGWFLIEKPAAPPLIYKTPINLHKLNPDVGLARFSSVPRRWIDPGPTLHDITRYSFDPMSSQCLSRAVCNGLALDRLGSLLIRINF